MKRVIMIAGAWAAATVVAAAVAWAAVGIVGNQVSETVDLPLSAAEVAQIVADRAATTIAPATVPPTTATAIPPVTITRPPVTTTAAPPATTTATTAPQAPTTTVTTAPPGVTTTAPRAPTTTYAEETRAISVTGGTIVVRWSSAGGARLTSATPDQGWYVEVENSGPPSVEVKFESTADRETEIHVEVSDGELRIDVGEE